jgi:hypothetical protein
VIIKEEFYSKAVSVGTQHFPHDYEHDSGNPKGDEKVPWKLCGG